MIKKFTWDKDMKYAKEGCHAKNTTFVNIDRSKPEGHPQRERTISVFNYFKEKYNIQLAHWNLPLIVTTRDGMFPMEVCELLPNQKYQYKLSPDQVSFQSSLTNSCLHY
jgi:eukaryotic translation initiation factor 2C